MKQVQTRRQIKGFLLAVSLLTILAGIAAAYRGTQIGALEYTEHLDDWLVRVNGKEYHLRDAAVYIGYQEMQVEEQAKVYDLKNTNRYWNVRGKDAMVRSVARQTAMDMLIHDVIFSEMAYHQQLELTEEEIRYMSNQQMDFWNDLENTGQERIGIDEEELSEQFSRMALAQKMQQRLADQEGVDYREYTVGGSSYEVLLKSNSYEIHETLWERLRFGNIVLEPNR